MRRSGRAASSALALLVAAATSACAPGGGMPALGVANVPLIATGTSPTVDGTPIEIYTIVGRNALNCWFGANGPLRRSHIYHADAAPPAAGGGAEIVLHARDPAAANPRGIRAYRISFAAEGPDRTRVTQETLKLEADLAAAMAQDVATWARGGEACAAQVVRPPPPEPPVAAPSKKKKSRLAAALKR